MSSGDQKNMEKTSTLGIEFIHPQQMEPQQLPIKRKHYNGGVYYGNTCIVCELKMGNKGYLKGKLT